MRIKAHDHTAIPLCSWHHLEEWHKAAGFFAAMGEDQMRGWADEQITQVQATLLAVIPTGK
jgi:hypothetical protein